MASKFCLEDLSGCELISLANAISLMICQNADDCELEKLALLFRLIHDNLKAALFIKILDEKQKKDS